MFLFVIIYLSAPVFLVLFSFFSYPFVVSSSVALTVLIFCLYRTQREEDNRFFCLQAIVRYWPLLLVTITITSLCFVSPFDVWDWDKHFAFFNLLQEKSWPPVIELNGDTWFLRFYLGWYMLPALFVKIFGASLLTPSMLIWTAAGMLATLVIAFHQLDKARYLFIATLVFLLFSSLDIVGAWLNNSIPPLFPNWPQTWTSWGEIWPALTSLAWSPHHTIPSWLGVVIFLYKRCYAVQYGAVLIIMVAMWSPFSAIGLLPVATWALLKEGIKNALTPQNLLVAPLLAVPIVLYMLQQTDMIPFMFSWEHANFSVIGFIIFCLIEFLLILIILHQIRPKERELIIVVAIFLTSICLFRYGVMNDLLVRGSIPLVCLMSIWVARSMLENRDWRRVILATYMMVAAVPVMVAFVEGIKPTMPRAYREITLKEFLHKTKSPEADYLYQGNLYQHYFLARASHVLRIYNIPLVRGLPDSGDSKE